METERGCPLLRQRAPGLPRVAVKLDRPFDGLGERRDAAPARILPEPDHAAVVQRLSAGFGERHLGVRPEPDRGQVAIDPDPLPPCLGDPAIDRPVDPQTQPAPAAPVPVDAGSAYCAHEGCRERPAWTRRRSGVFFYLVPGRLENLDLHGLLPQGPLQIANALLGGAELAHRHNLLVRGNRGRATLRAQMLPPPHYRGRDCQLPCQLRKRQLLAYDPSDLLLLELRGKEAATIRSPTMCFHPTTLR